MAQICFQSSEVPLLGKDFIRKHSANWKDCLVFILPFKSSVCFTPGVLKCVLQSSITFPINFSHQNSAFRCNPGCPGTHSVDHARLELRDLSISAPKCWDQRLCHCAWLSLLIFHCLLRFKFNKGVIFCMFRYFIIGSHPTKHFKQETLKIIYCVIMGAK